VPATGDGCSASWSPPGRCRAEPGHGHPRTDRGPLHEPVGHRITPSTEAVVRAVLHDRQLIGYVLLAVLLSWSWWVPVALTGGTARHLPGLLGPLLAAVAVTVISDGRAGLRRLRGWLRAPRWWGIALLPFVVGATTAAVLHLTGDGPAAAAFADMPGIPRWSWPVVLLVLLAVGGLGEEAGRGVDQPRRRGLRRASGLGMGVVVRSRSPPVPARAGCEAGTAC
jgi:hypothetical protein